MAVDPRDTIWDAAYFLWYDTKYNVELASRMVDRLKALDDVTKVLVALTASGSAVAGWNLWSKNGFATAWVITAGAAALLSISHGSLGIPARLKDWLEMKRDFLGLRSGLDTFRSNMENHPDFDVAKSEEILAGFRGKFGEYEGRIPSDFFVTSGLKLRCQDGIDAEIRGRTSPAKQEIQDAKQS
jgi:hypothetical protein